MKKIVILGAGIGGLTLASLLDNTKYDIVVYDSKKSKDDLGFLWEDDVNLNKLKDIGFDFKINNDNESWNINSPSGDIINFESDKDEIAPLNRKLLAQELYKRASKKAIINFNSNIRIENNFIKTNGKNIDDYDLVIDCRGFVNSNQQQTFNTRRIIIKQKTDQQNRNIFLKPCNINGVAWCNFNEDEIDILIGEIGTLKNTSTKNILNFFDEKYNISYNEDEIDQSIYKIPVRYPSLLFFNNKYVILGDMANMTVPIIGSGIVNTMEASYILADLLNNSDISQSFDSRNNLLWQYQYKYFQKNGISSSQIDIFKNWLLSTKEYNVDYLFKNQIINSNDLKNVMVGDFIDYDIISLIEKAKKLYSNPKLTVDLANTLLKAITVKQLIKTMPKNYNDIDINRWRKSIVKVLKY